MRRFISLVAGVEYILVEKAACTAIKAALLDTDNLGCEDDVHAHVHPAWTQVHGDWRPRLTFTCVRHPLDRLVSAYESKLKTGDAAKLLGACELPQDAPFAQWVEWVCMQAAEQVDPHWAPQTTVLQARGGVPQFTLRFEKLRDQWLQLRTAFGLAPLERRNVTRFRGPWQSYYDQRSLKLAKRFYAADLARWGYTCESPA